MNNACIGYSFEQSASCICAVTDGFKQTLHCAQTRGRENRAKGSVWCSGVYVCVVRVYYVCWCCVLLFVAWSVSFIITVFPVTWECVFCVCCA